MRAASFITDLTRSTRPMPEPFRQLTVLEPRLAELWDDACYYSRYWAGYPCEKARGKSASRASIKRDLSLLAGPGRYDRDDILGSKQAYACAERALMDAMGV